MLSSSEEFIGITENRLHHILGVARKCYKIAKDENHDEDFCRKMFMIGWVHDVGYEFSVEQYEHPARSVELLQYLDVCDYTALEAVRKHGGTPPRNMSDEKRILIIADLTTDSEGNDVDITKRLNDIKSRYGEYSNQYLTACDTSYVLGLTAVNLSMDTTI